MSLSGGELGPKESPLPDRFETGEPRATITRIEEKLGQSDEDEAGRAKIEDVRSRF